MELIPLQKRMKVMVIDKPKFQDDLQTFSFPINIENSHENLPLHLKLDFIQITPPALFVPLSSLDFDSLEHDLFRQPPSQQ
jgi:hypothetical protein